jgi:microcystin-dependent protein
MAKTEFGQELSSQSANSVYLLKTENDIISGIVSLQNGIDANKHLSDTQEHIYTIGQIIGIVGENDPNALIYASKEIIADGDNRKVAIEKLDAQVKINIDNIASNLVLINQNASDIADIIASLGVDSNTAPLAVGIATLDADGKIPVNQLPNALLQYQGTWDASLNDPALDNTDTGVQNFWYRVNVAGSVDFGAGSITFKIGDKVVNNGSIWEKWDTNDEVTSVFGRTGDVTAQTGDYTPAQVGLGNVTNDAQLKREAGDLNTFAEKFNGVDADVMLIEDSEDLLNKKKLQLSNLPDKRPNVTNDAQLKREAADFDTFTQKVTPVDVDVMLIEDSEDSLNKKKINLSDLPDKRPNVTNDAQLKREAADLDTFTEKLTPANTDILIIEDSEDSLNKKKIQIANLPFGDDLNNVTNDAQLKREAADFDTFPEKLEPVGEDLILIEDSEDGFSKKKLPFSSLPTGGGGGGTSTIREYGPSSGNVVSSAVNLGTVNVPNMNYTTTALTPNPTIRIVPDDSTNISNIRSGRLRIRRDGVIVKQINMFTTTIDTNVFGSTADDDVDFTSSTPLEFVDSGLTVGQSYTYSIDIERAQGQDGPRTLDGQVEVQYMRFEIEYLDAPSGAGGAAPVGTLLPFAGEVANIPTGYLLCDGSLVLRADFPALFTAIGTNWGTDTVDDFRLPNTQGLILRGQANGSVNDPDSASRIAIAAGGSTGDAVGSYQADENKQHLHGAGTYEISHPNSSNKGSNGYDPNGGTNPAPIPVTGNSANSGGSESRPKNVYVNYIIKF